MDKIFETCQEKKQKSIDLFNKDQHTVAIANFKSIDHILEEALLNFPYDENKIVQFQATIYNNLA